MQDKGYFMKAKAKSHQLDMLHGSIWNKLPRFALPVAATAILEQLFNASDVAVVGNFAGDAAEKTAAVAAVGANTAIIGLIVNLFVGIALGANVVIANAIGRDDKDAVHRAVHTSILVALLGGAAIAVIGELIAGTLLHSLNVPDDVYPLALLYLRIYLLGMPVILLYNFEAAIFRSIGDTKVPLIALACSGVLNVILNLFFVAVLGMTVNGVAIATVISNALSSLILFIRLIRTDKYIKLEPRSLRIDGQSMKLILKIGLPAGIQSAVFSLSNIVIQSAINSLGKVVMAASSAALNIELLAYYVLNSFSQACTTFVGQNYGARQIDRCRKTLLLSILEDFIASAIAIGIVLLSGRFLLSIFNSDPEVIEIGYTRLIYLFSAYVFSMLYEVLSGYMRGFGISLIPAILTTIGVCGIRIFWINFVFPQNPTFTTIMTVYPISLSSTALLIGIALLCFRPAHRYFKKEKENAVHDADRI
jgi:MATE efflux family protein